MDDRERSDHQQLVADSRRIREVAREAIANAKATIARSKAILQRQRDAEPQPVAAVSPD